MADAITGGASAPLVRLRGIRGNQVSVIWTDFGERWVTVTLHWLDGDEPVAVALDPRDAKALGVALLDQAAQAVARNAGEMN